MHRMIATVDANRLRQAIANLVDNGIKYTPRGGSVIISIRERGGNVEILVQDTGHGIAGPRRSLASGSASIAPT